MKNSVFDESIVKEGAKNYQEYMIPFEKITQLQMNTGEKLARSQTAFMNSLWSQSMAFGEQLFSKKDPSDYFKAQQTFFEDVSKQMRDAAEQSLEVMTDANERIVAIFHESMAEAGANLNSAKVPGFAAQAAKTAKSASSGKRTASAAKSTKSKSTGSAKKTAKPASTKTTSKKTTSTKAASPKPATKDSTPKPEPVVTAQAKPAEAEPAKPAASKPAEAASDKS